MTTQESFDQINSMINKLPTKDREAIHTLNMQIVAMLAAAGPVIGGSALCLANATFAVTMETARDAARA